MNFSQYLLNEACKQEACESENKEVEKESCCKEEVEAFDGEFDSIFKDKDEDISFDSGLAGIEGVEAEGCCKEATEDDDPKPQPQQFNNLQDKKDALKEAFAAYIDALGEEAEDVTFGDVEKIEPVEKEGLDAAIAAEDDFVQAPDVADGYNAAEENLNNQVDAELEAAFADDSEEDAGSVEGEFVNPTEPVYNAEEDQFSEEEDDSDLAKYADIDISDNELAESFTGWDDLD